MVIRKIGLVLTLLWLCSAGTAPVFAKTKTPPRPAVRIVSDTPIVPELEETPALDSAAGGDTAAADDTTDSAIDATEAADDGEEAAEEAVEPVDRPPSAREALESAIEWAREGVRLYRSGEHARARESLNDARIVLLEADLPEAMQEQGLSVLDCTLGPELAGANLEAIARDLDDEIFAKDPSELAERDFVEREVRRILARFGDTSPAPEHLETFTDQVGLYIGFYRGKYREFFERAYWRKHKYWPTIRRVFEAKRIPIEQGYMALVESGFNPLARSRANARGLWQFIPGTGRRYGLAHHDDFYDVELATEAASEYLLDLIGIFGSDSFLLATAAYNAGEGKIVGCLRTLADPFASRSFWEIRGCLARETREYVPSIFAAAVIASDPKRFGFELPSEDEVAAAYDVVTVAEPTSLSSLAKRAGVTVADLRSANTDLSSQATATPVRNFPLYVPRGAGAPLLAELAPEPEEAGGVEEPTLAAELGLVAPATEPTRLETPPPAPPARTSKTSSTQYRVRKGDTLSEIATRHGVSVRDLMHWNRLRSASRIQPGQQLQIRSTSAPPALTYTVRAGNSLHEIAQVFSVRYRDVMSWNGLHRSTVAVGQKLKIHPPRPYRATSYTVRSGDTPAKIARRFGVATTAVLTANGLGTRSVIRTGEKLTIWVPA